MTEFVNPEFKEFEYKLSKNWLQVWRKDEKDGITWDELQSVKNQIFGEEVTAVEIYPAMSQLVNIKNVRHLWVLPTKIELPNLRKMVYPKEKQNEPKPEIED